MTASRFRERIRSHRALTSASRPKKTDASFSVKDRSPGYGLRSSTSRSDSPSEGAASTASSATTTSWPEP
jgi:hypothetical protein